MLKRKKTKKEKKISMKKVNKNAKKNSKVITEKDIFSNSPKLIELLVPDCIEEKRDFIVLGEQRYSRSFVLSTYPSRSYIGWLDRIINQIGDINLSMIIETSSSDAVIKQLTKKVTVLESEFQTYEAKGNIELLSPLAQMKDDYEKMRQQVQIKEDRLFYITILLRINAKDIDELNEKSEILKTEFAKMSAKVRTLNFRQIDGLKANLPLNTSNILDFERNIVAEGLATMFQISNSNAESSPSGVLIGRNYFTGLPVYLDTFEKSLANPHMAILRRIRRRKICYT